jgi:hypothetical protein
LKGKPVSKQRIGFMLKCALNRKAFADGLTLARKADIEPLRVLEVLKNRWHFPGSWIRRTGYRKGVRFRLFTGSFLALAFPRRNPPSLPGSIASFCFSGRIGSITFPITASAVSIAPRLKPFRFMALSKLISISLLIHYQYQFAK